MTDLILFSNPIEIEIEKLRAEINRHNELYYQKSAPEIPDADFDALLERLKQLETENSSPFISLSIKFLELPKFFLTNGKTVL